MQAKINATKIVIVSGSILNISSVPLNCIWHLIWRYQLKPVLGGHPVLSGHYSIPRGCPLNTGFTIFSFLNMTSNRGNRNNQLSLFVFATFDLIRWGTVVPVIVVLNRTVVDSDWRFAPCAAVIFRVKVSCITSSRHVTGYEDSKMSFVIVSSQQAFLFVELSVVQSFCRC